MRELKKKIKDIQKQLAKFSISDYFSEENFLEDEYETYGTLEICGNTYDTLRVLRDIDPKAFRQEYLNYIDNNLDCEDQPEYIQLKAHLAELQEELDDYEDRC